MLNQLPVVPHFVPAVDQDTGSCLSEPSKPVWQSRPWIRYQADIPTMEDGHGHVRVIGKFSNETFAVAPGSGPAPVTFTPHPVDDEGNSIGSASSNPQFGPIQMYHLGVWFDSPVDAENAGCADAVTPFNGTHDAGIQVLNTSNFPADKGPLSQITN